MKIEIFQGNDSQWYWHLKSTQNGRIVCCGGEGFASKGNAWSSAKLVADVFRVRFLQVHNTTDDSFMGTI